MADNQFQKPQGEMAPASKNMKDCGTSTGVTDTYGADLSGSACNKMHNTAGGNFIKMNTPGGGHNDGGGN